MTTNPVQQSIDKLVNNWQRAYSKKGIKVVCISYKEKETSMIDAFMDYILALDSEIENFVWVFESEFLGHNSYANAILKEMEELIATWNTMDKPAQYDTGTIDWIPNYSLVNDKNPMSVLVKNLNDFAKYLFPEKNSAVCYVFKAYSMSKKEALKWMDYALEFDFEKHVTWTVAQSDTYPFFEKAIDLHASKIAVLEPKMDVNGLVEQLAAQADTTKPENKYRLELIKLMHAVEDRNDKKVSLQTKLCLDIILEELKNDPNWISQVVTVYVVLYNDQIGNKNYKEALYFATKAVEAAEAAKKTIEPSMSYRLAAQTHIGRGSIYVLLDNWQKAHEDYAQAKLDYQYCNDFLMMAEACRLCGWSRNEYDKFENALPFYEEGFYLHEKIDASLITSSSYPLLLKEVIYNDKFVKLITKDKLDKVLIPLFGKDYSFTLDNYGKR